MSQSKIVPVLSWNYSAQNTKLTKLAFRNRFFFTERVVIETLAETDPMVRVLLKDQDSAMFIDLSREDTISGVQMLVGKGVLTEERASVILATNTITFEETYKG
jgi:hypothetical protein